MDFSPTAVVKLLLPKTPLILKTAVLNTLSLSKNSSKQDTITEVGVTILRQFLLAKKPLGSVQRVGLKDPGIKGPMWISKAAISTDGAEEVRDALVKAIKELGDGTETYRLPDLKDVEGEWTGYRKGVDKHAPELDISEQEKYDRLMLDVESPVTILYFHGGAYVVMDPASYRNFTSHLAELTKGRCFSVRYRLAPQNPFPAQLLDALIAYLSLLSPPPGACHTPVAAKDIVFVGDSAGGNLSLALLQTLLTLTRAGVTTIPFHGKDVKIELPAGVALNSPWCDIARTMPSLWSNAQFDYLSPPSATGGVEEPPADDVWPTKPPRAEIFCGGSILIHPLVSPLAAKADLWRGSCPVWMCVGNEGLEDEISIMARRFHEAGVPIVFDGYEGMPHCFAMVFMKSPAGKECFRSWSEFCVEAVAGTVERRDTGRWMKAFSHPLQFREVRLEEITKITDLEVDEKLEKAKRKTMQRDIELLKNWNERQSKPHL